MQEYIHKHGTPLTREQAEELLKEYHANETIPSSTQ